MLKPSGKYNVFKDKKKLVGDGGYRSPYLSHAKRALYHLSYVPWLPVEGLEAGVLQSRKSSFVLTWPWAKGGAPLLNNNERSSGFWEGGQKYYFLQQFKFWIGERELARKSGGFLTPRGGGGGGGQEVEEEEEGRRWRLCGGRLGGRNSRVAQWKRAGPITQRSVDRNHALLMFFMWSSFLSKASKANLQTTINININGFFPSTPPHPCQNLTVQSKFRKLIIWGPWIKTLHVKFVIFRLN